MYSTLIVDSHFNSYHTSMFYDVCTLYAVISAQLCSWSLKECYQNVNSSFRFWLL